MQWLAATATIGVVASAAYRARRDVSRQILMSFVVGSVLWTAYAFTRSRGLFSGDEGVKLVQTMAVAEGQLHLPYPAETVDPAHRAFPFRPPFVVDRGTRHYGIYASTFTAPSALGWALFGYWGLHLLPLLGGVLALWSTLRLAQRIFDDDRWAIAAGVVLLTTPLVLNATVFNEHALATGLLSYAVLVAAGGPRGRVQRSSAASRSGSRRRSASSSSR